MPERFAQAASKDATNFTNENIAELRRMNERTLG